MERTFISWNITNWMTVIAMAGLGYGLFALASQAYKAWFGSRMGG